MEWGGHSSSPASRSPKQWNVSGTETNEYFYGPLIKGVAMVEAGELKNWAILKTRNLLAFRGAQNAEIWEIALNWNAGFSSKKQNLD
jgi:hypothetical protein